MYIPKMRDFIEDPKEEILGNQGFWAREASYHATTLQEVGILPSLVYFPPEGLFGCVFFPKRLLGCFFCPKGLFRSNFGTVGNDTLF